jgi:enamine deaminase RidA (YjgF/YER057c/UK114 family)
MAFEFVRTDPRVPRTPYALAAVVEEGTRLVITAGACPLGMDYRMIGSTYEEQAKEAVANLAVELEAAGAGLHDVVKTTVYVASANRDDLLAAWTAVHDAFGDLEPASTLIGVTTLAYPDQLVEIDAIAALD